MTESIIQWLEQPQLLSEEERYMVDALLKKHPYFVPGHYLKAFLDNKIPGNRQHVAASMVLYKGNWVFYENMLQKGHYQSRSLKPASKPESVSAIVANAQQMMPVIAADGMDDATETADEAVTGIADVAATNHLFAAEVVGNDEAEEPADDTAAETGLTEPAMVYTAATGDNLTDEIVKEHDIEQGIPMQEENFVVPQVQEAEDVSLPEIPETVDGVLETDATAETEWAEDDATDIPVTTLLHTATEDAVADAADIITIADTTGVDAINEITVSEQPLEIIAGTHTDETATGIADVADIGIQPEDLPQQDEVTEDTISDIIEHNIPLEVSEDIMTELPEAIDNTVFLPEFDGVPVAELVVTEAALETAAVEADTARQKQPEGPVADKYAIDQDLVTEDFMADYAETAPLWDKPMLQPEIAADYFMQQGIAVDDELPVVVAINANEDKSLLVMMSYAEWLNFFQKKTVAAKEEEEEKKALKSMWQREKLAAALGEQEDEIPENVFEMAVNSLAKEEGLVSESLAEIFIKQGKYDKALEMFHKLKLRNPQKSTYFATRIAEIQKEKDSES